MKDHGRPWAVAFACIAMFATSATALAGGETDPSERGLTTVDGDVTNAEYAESVMGCQMFKMDNGPAKGQRVFQPSCLREVRRTILDEASRAYRSAWESVPPARRRLLWNACRGGASRWDLFGQCLADQSSKYTEPDYASTVNALFKLFAESSRKALVNGYADLKSSFAVCRSTGGSDTVKDERQKLADICPVKEFARQFIGEETGALKTRFDCGKNGCPFDDYDYTPGPSGSRSVHRCEMAYSSGLADQMACHEDFKSYFTAVQAAQPGDGAAEQKGVREAFYDLLRKTYAQGVVRSAVDFTGAPPALPTSCARFKIPLDALAEKVGKGDTFAKELNASPDETGKKVLNVAKTLQFLSERVSAATQQLGMLNANTAHAPPGAFAQEKAALEREINESKQDSARLLATYPFLVGKNEAGLFEATAFENPAGLAPVRKILAGNGSAAALRDVINDFKGQLGGELAKICPADTPTEAAPVPWNELADNQTLLNTALDSLSSAGTLREDLSRYAQCIRDNKDRYGTAQGAILSVAFALPVVGEVTAAGTVAAAALGLFGSGTALGSSIADYLSSKEEVRTKVTDFAVTQGGAATPSDIETAVTQQKIAAAKVAVTAVVFGIQGTRVAGKLLEVPGRATVELPDDVAQRFTSASGKLSPELRGELENIKLGLTEDELAAIQKAHAIGKPPYTLADLTAKAKVLRDAGFTYGQRQALLRGGVCGIEEDGTSSEIIWGKADCEFCGAKMQSLKPDPKTNLATCTNCGHPLDTQKAVLGLETDPNTGQALNVGGNAATTPQEVQTALAGADDQCPFCNTMVHKTSPSCPNCGAPKNTWQAAAEQSHGPAVIPGASSANPEPIAEAAGSGGSSTGTALKIGAGVAAAGAIGYGAYKIFKPKPREGTVTRAHWTRTVELKRFTPTTARAWKSDIPSNPSSPPVNGSGGVIGASNVHNCKSEHKTDVPVACGSHIDYTSDTYNSDPGKSCDSGDKKLGDGTKQVQDGYDKNKVVECHQKNLGNGAFKQVCTYAPKYKTVSYEKCGRPHKQIDYCPKAVYEDKCDYDTYFWASLAPAVSSGDLTSNDAKIANPAYHLDPMDVASPASSSYEVVIDFNDGSSKHSTTRNPTDESEFRQWPVGRKVKLMVTVGSIVTSATPE